MSDASTRIRLWISETTQEKKGSKGWAKIPAFDMEKWIATEQEIRRAALRVRYKQYPPNEATFDYVVNHSCPIPI